MSALCIPSGNLLLKKAVMIRIIPDNNVAQQAIFRNMLCIGNKLQYLK